MLSALEQGHEEISKFLLSQGVNIEDRDSKGRTALMLAINTRNSNILPRILSSLNVSSIDYQDNEGKTALMLAAGDKGSFEQSMKKNVTLDNQSSNGIKSALNHAIANYWTHEVALVQLLKHGASIDIQDNKGRTALMYATFFGNANIVKVLLKHQANVGILDGLGQSALSYAFKMFNSMQEKTRLLVAHVKTGNTLLKEGS